MTPSTVFAVIGRSSTSTLTPAPNELTTRRLIAEVARRTPAQRDARIESGADFYFGTQYFRTDGPRPVQGRMASLCRSQVARDRRKRCLERDNRGTVVFTTTRAHLARRASPPFHE